VLGVAPGWDEHEFQTLGMRLRERGRRTDEMLAALTRLLTERDVSFAGDFYRFESVTIEPRLSRFPELWVGGGSKLLTPLSPDKPSIVPPVLARIAAADGWLSRAAGTQQMVKDDVRAVYFLGTTPEILDRIRDLEAAGIQDLVLATCADHLEQLERFASESSGHFASARAEMLWSIAFDDHLGLVVSDICLVDPNPEEGRASASGAVARLPVGR
jgi:alkanesulfonate monooxygenase SsuD/methylene tetrahydromethanopterin reductase-like flavin-dependent oxidoreductase (luciferase family)